MNGAVVVGNAPYGGRRLGARIDAFETVIRLNNFRLGRHAPYLGRKTDIWVFVQNRWCVVHPRRERFREIWRICSRWPPAAPAYFDPIIGGTPCQTIRGEELTPLVQRLRGTAPSSGCVAVHFAIQRWGVVHVANFNHFSSPRLHYYRDGELENVCHDGDAERALFAAWEAEGTLRWLPEP